MPKAVGGSQMLLEAALPTVEAAIRFACRRHHCSSDDAEEFASFARLRLIEDDCAILRRFEGRCELRTFLGVVLQRLFIDFRRQCWGVWRPSVHARRLGPVGVLLDRLISRDGMNAEQAIETALTQDPDRGSRDQLRAVVARLPRHGRRRVEGEEAISELSVPAASVEEPLLDQERGRRVSEVRAALRSLLDSLADEDALLLRLRFEDGMPVARIAQLLQLEAKPLYRRVERLLGRLRSGLGTQGVDAREVAQLMESGAFDRGDP